MIRPELHILWAGAGSLLAALAIGNVAGATDPVSVRYNGAETVMASYVETVQRPEVGATSSATASEIYPETDGLYYVQAHLSDGRRLRFLVDTGASVTILTARDAAMLGVGNGPQAKSAKLRTAGGTMTARSATIGSMRIAGRELRNIEAAIIDNGLPVSLLGQNALSELGTITLGNGRMTIG